MKRLFEMCFVTLLAAALAGWFWRPLLEGAGFVGGDVYNYFFPLKKHYADGLKNNEIRFWHPGIGNGVPVLGESQTGVFYPFYLLAYRCLDLNEAYNAVHVFHYLLAFGFIYALAREAGLRVLPSTFASLIFVYGWFPLRACLEWAIVTGTWLPACALFALRYFRRGKFADGVWLAVCHAIQLFAGHFQLAFVTELAVATLGIAHLAQHDAVQPFKRRLIRVAGAAAFLVAGLLLAAPQLLPSWTLKQRSQRQDPAFAMVVDFGNVPLWSLIQWLDPSGYYREAENLIRVHGGTTNLVEGHLYFGYAGLGLAVAGLIGLLRPPRRSTETPLLPWIMLAIFGLILAEGSVFRVLRNLPGFGFFRYPGRYGLLAQLGVALIAGATLQRLARWSAARFGSLGIVAGMVASFSVMGLTAYDFFLVSRARGANQVGYVTFVNPPPISKLNESVVFSKLQPFDRIFAPDGNTLALSGASCVPPYLGLGPAEYFKVWSKVPDLFHGATAIDSEELRSTLYGMGVTCILTEKPLPKPKRLADEYRLEWSGYDPFLHPRWGRNPAEPLYLYRVRIRGVRAQQLVLGEILIEGNGDELMAFTSDEILYRVVAFEDNVPFVLTDLNYPGWTCILNGVKVESSTKEMFRTAIVQKGGNEIIWTFRDLDFHRGVYVMIGTALTLLVVSRFRRSTLE